jgi:hypothetical protein
MNYSIVDVKSGKKGRPAKLVKFTDGSEIMLKEWIKVTPEGKLFAKELRKAKKVVAQVSTPVEAPTAPVAESVGIGA